MKKSIALIILLLSFSGFAQFSKTHYIPPLSGSTSLTSEDQYLYISTPNVNPINFKIIELGGNTILGTVSRDAPYIHYIGFGNDTQLHVAGVSINTILANKGYIVEADDMIYVSARVTAGNGNQAGELVSKGLASLGTHFRIGAFTNESAPSYGSIHHTFISVLATENNTNITFSDFKPGVLLYNTNTGSAPVSITLNSGESYVIGVEGPNNANRGGLIGSLVTSDRPIAVNCGSFGGTNGEMANLDLGFDQIVSSERTGKEYVFIKSTGMDNVERILLVADVDNTEVYLDGATTPSYLLNAGDYVALNGSQYNAAGNLYVRTSENIFAYQSVGDNGLPSQANQEMFFVPPLSCQTPHVIDNIPFIEYVGDRPFNGRVTMVTQTGATLNFIINGINYTLASLPGASVDGPNNVMGNPNYQTYVITGLTGNVSVYSTGELYLAAYGSSDAATFGGFFSGFTFKPEISFTKLDPSESSCIPNSVLSVNTLSPFDTFQWFFNNVLMPGATSSSFTPTVPGNYYVSATISSCGTTIDSDNIPVSDCPPDTDNDGVNNNIDLDNDNDGITNCTESYGNQNFNFTNTNAGTIAVGNYSNSYTGAAVFSGTGAPATTPIVGDALGNFVTETTSGINNKESYTVSNFTKPISLSLEYATVAAATDLFISATEIRVNCPVNQTLTILNPTNQLLIDTNYDGIYESGVTQFSSFEIRFRLNGVMPLVPGTGTFSIKGNLITSLTITNINLTDLINSKVALRLIASCVPLDSDNDGIADQNDYDSDNDSIPDFIESQGQNVVALSNVDVNGDGIDDVFNSGLTPANNDGDTIPNYLDYDSDNDGIFDIIESGSPGNGSNTSGIMI
ncbi:IgGFc-binding protein, partial [Flavobacterium sp.]